MREKIAEHCHDNQWSGRIEALEAQNAKLRAALEDANERFIGIAAALTHQPGIGNDEGAAMNLAHGGGLNTSKALAETEKP